MENNGKKCYNCGNYDCYYTKAFMHYNREKIGYCNQYKKITEHKESCELWRSSQFKRRRLSVISIQALNETIATLTEVTDIIIEDIENKHLHYLARERLEKKLDAIEAELEKGD